MFHTTSVAAARVIEAKAAGHNVLGNPRLAVTDYVSQRKINEGTYPSLAVLVNAISAEVDQYGSLAKVPAEAVGNTRNDMYLASEAIRFLLKDKENDLSKEEIATLNAYKKSLDNATKFIPTWVKIAVAIALGLGTMIGWKRIVITVGEKIGKSHLTYAQGASAEVVAAGTIEAGRRVRASGVNDACAVIRRRRHHGRERLGLADGDRAQSIAGLGADAALRDLVVRHSLRGLRADLLTAID